MKFRFLAAALTAMIALPALAQAAATGFATSNVNMRSGPSTAYPAVVVIPQGARMKVYGCLSNANWCDVSFARGRGWVSGRYIQIGYGRDQYYVDRPYYRQLGIPTIRFDIDDYWGRNYRNRDFYRERDDWRRRAPRPTMDQGWDNPRPRPPQPAWGNDNQQGWDNPRPPRPRQPQPTWGNDYQQNWGKRRPPQEEPVMPVSPRDRTLPQYLPQQQSEQPRPPRPRPPEPQYEQPRPQPQQMEQPRPPRPQREESVMPTSPRDKPLPPTPPMPCPPGQDCPLPPTPQQ
ncbi:MAG: SH3 domain-containing protein [Proteobacteria bacterium]|nr:SH3 domain-containing protein [Pseudomonadota bacterium]